MPVLNKYTGFEILDETGEEAFGVHTEYFATGIGDIEESRAYTRDEATAKLFCAAPEMLEACEKSISRMKQLCETVNTLSNKLGLGNKVRVDDFIDLLTSVIARAKGEV